MAFQNGFLIPPERYQFAAVFISSGVKVCFTRLTQSIGFKPPTVIGGRGVLVPGIFLPGRGFSVTGCPLNRFAGNPGRFDPFSR